MNNSQTQDGILIIDKPADWTSHDVVAKLRKVVGTQRIGHTGTLDPFATGVLVLCINRATRLVQYLTAEDKEYVATMRLGFATDTGDLTGQAVGAAVDASQLTADDVCAVLPRFVGHLQQTPPMYSAKKIGGQKLYELARRGETVERAAINIEIKELELLAGESSVFSFRVVCSAGTYIRTLAEDIGRQLGVGAHLTALRRTRVGSHTLAQAQTLAALAAGEALPRFVPMREALDYPEFMVNEMERAQLCQGQTLRRVAPVAETPLVKCVDEIGTLIALVEYDAVKKGWQPRVVLSVQTEAQNSLAKR